MSRNEDNHELINSGRFEILESDNIEKETPVFVSTFVIMVKTACIGLRYKSRLVA